MTRILSLEDYAHLAINDCEWIIPGYLPKPGMLMILGEPRAGKSFLGLQLALAIAHGTPLIPGTVTHQKRVLYLYFDKTGPFAFQERLQGFEKHGVDLKGPLFMIHPSDTIGSVNLLDLTHYGFFADCIEQTQPDVIVFDVLREFHNADENESTAMKRVGDAITSLTHGRSVIMIHHTKKLDPEKGVPRNVDACRGSNYIAGKADATWLIHQGYLYTESNFSPAVRHKLSGRLPDGRWVIAAGPQM